MTHPLRQYRDRNGISATEFSKTLNLSRQSLHRIEAGEQTPSGELLRRIAERTGGEVTPNDMLAISPCASVSAVAAQADIGAAATVRHVNESAAPLPAGSAR